MRLRTFAIALTVLATMVTFSVATACTEKASAEITVKAVNEAGQTTACAVAVVTTADAQDKHDKHTGPVATVKATVRAGATVGRAVWSTFSTVVATLIRTAVHTVGEIT